MIIKREFYSGLLKSTLWVLVRIGSSKHRQHVVLWTDVEDNPQIILVCPPYQRVLSATSHREIQTESKIVESLEILDIFVVLSLNSPKELDMYMLI